MKSTRFSIFIALIITALGGCQTPVEEGNTTNDENPTSEVEVSTSELTPSCSETVIARVVAIDQVITYNRFGAFNPVGMIYALERDVKPISGATPSPGNAQLRPDKRPRPLVLRVNVGQCLEVHFKNLLSPAAPVPPPSPVADPDGAAGAEAPTTRTAGFHVSGLQYVSLASDGAYVGRNSSSLIPPGGTAVYRYYADHEGGFMFHSTAANIGGQGNGGSLALGLFGVINVEPTGSKYYRSQVTQEQLAAASTGVNRDGTPRLDFDKVDANGIPILRMLDASGEIVHADLNAIITSYAKPSLDTPSSRDTGHFREFTVVFHDELKAVQAFPELTTNRALHGVRDGFGINYGAAGLGAEILAHRKKIGPAKDCAECKFEEFFLESAVNGDPAMVLDKDAHGVAVAALYPDDPSNVHHSYLGDPVRFRNIHAGPRETHVFHLHAHQWMNSPADDNSVYLDSQTIGPGAAMTYNINYGGGGNRNFTVGDAIFHCHLYPHFAQGMWELWRNHDVFEDGSPARNLPDAEIAQGTPNPAIVPIPGRGMPPMPTYAPSQVTLANGQRAVRPAMPGYPFYIAHLAGHRPPQPPLDIVHSGGLDRHIITSGAALYGRRGAFDVELDTANLKLLPTNGTFGERSAMAYHAGTFPGGARVTAPNYGWPAAAYPAFTPDGQPSSFIVNGQPPVGGAPFAEPCPPTAPLRTYKVAYIQQDIAVNKAGWHDPQARFMVLNGDVADTRSGRRPPEPFFFRANSGECINFEATNLIPNTLAADDFQLLAPTDTIGQHIHLVKFDVTSSDGSGNGWNYEDGTFSPDEVVERIQAANKAGGAFSVDGNLTATGPRIQLTATTNPYFPDGPVGAQTTIQRWWADPLLNRQGKDRTIRTVFTHDHFGPSSAQHHGFYGALVVEPAGSLWRESNTGVLLGTRDDGGPTSYKAMVIPPDTSKSVREFALAIADYAIVYDAFGQPVNPPNFREAALPKAIEHAPTPAPESISTADPGSVVINYRNEPIPLRLAKRNADGTYSARAEADMAQVFSSYVHGDPATPLLEAYQNDNVQIRLIQGAQENQHSFSLHGHRWLNEIDSPDTGYHNAQALGISEHFEFNVGNAMASTTISRNTQRVVDFMYQGTSTDDLWNGAWGILRGHDTATPTLARLPNNPRTTRPQLAQEQCPPGAPKRIYEVHAITAKGNVPGDRVVYNEKYGLFDPDAILFVRAEHLAGLRAGVRKPEPLVLRANPGDCINVVLVNDLPAVMPKTPHWTYYPAITEGFNANQVPSSNAVSLHPQLVQYDQNKGDGADVGYNLSQIVPQGNDPVTGRPNRRIYRWYAGEYNPAKKINRPLELGVLNLRDMADVVNHGMHGAGGARGGEPIGARWTEAVGSSLQASVGAGATSFREFVLVYQDEVALHSLNPLFMDADPNANSGTALRNLGGADDPEDTGHKAFNFRTEPLWARLGLPPNVPENVINQKELTDLLASGPHGDPATPIFKATAGQRIRIRIAQPSGHTRQHAFTLHGAEWQVEGRVPGTQSAVIGSNPLRRIVSTQDGQTAMSSFNILPAYGAGGAYRVPGDYLYRDMPSLGFFGGAWGIMRVSP